MTFALISFAMSCDATQAIETKEVVLTREWEQQVTPLLKQYCFECHSDRRIEADINLATFKTLSDLRKHLGTWIKLREMLSSRQMPPPEVDQPSEAELDLLHKWVSSFLRKEAEALAGDPGPVVLRRLTNDEFTYSVRDLTGVSTLDPTREFPIDGAAGEGFTNTGNALVMSPSLVQKYLDAGKEIARHVVLLPDGIRFSTATTRRDQTDELLNAIRTFYGRHTNTANTTALDMQGLRFNVNEKGLLPVERYLRATLKCRDKPDVTQQRLRAIAEDQGLNLKYLNLLWHALNDNDEASPLLIQVRQHWKELPENNPDALVKEIAEWQNALWQFNKIGHLGKEAKPQAWMEAATPIVSQQMLRHKLPAPSKDGVVTVHLSSYGITSAEDRAAVEWRAPRIEFPGEEGQPAIAPIQLREVRTLADAVPSVMKQELARTAEYLHALQKLDKRQQTIESLTVEHSLSPALLENWARYFNIANHRQPEVVGLFAEKQTNVSGYAAINGWGKTGTPNLLTNRSNDSISFSTLTVPARGITVHPSPELDSAIAWRSSFTGRLHIQGRIADADDKCGNGAAWQVERVTIEGPTVLLKGTIDNGGAEGFETSESVAVRRGDLITLKVAARDKNHVCDTTHIEWTLRELDGKHREWDLANDVVDAILEGNPLPDTHGHPAIWHFCAVEADVTRNPSLPPGSLAARWREALHAGKSGDALASQVQRLLQQETSKASNEADRQLREELLNWHGPLNWVEVARSTKSRVEHRPIPSTPFGLAASAFGRPGQTDAERTNSLFAPTSSSIVVRLPARLVEGGQLVVDGRLDAPKTHGYAQLQVTSSSPEPRSFRPDLPFISSGTTARQQLEGAFEQLRNLFPAALCYSRIVPVDEAVTMTLFHREDEHLRRLMLDPEQASYLDRLWEELHYVSQEPLALQVAFEQISEFATQDRPDLVDAFAPLRKPITDRATAFRKTLKDSEPVHLQAVLELATRAWRRSLSSAEEDSLIRLYGQLRAQELPHDEALRLIIARVLTSPNFLYRLEKSGPGAAPSAVSDHELATRLSYFLWSSVPDRSLREVADRREIHEDATLVSQMRRMLKDPRVRRLAIQFACQWLHIREFPETVEKNEELYPEFSELRDAMYEEAVLFFENMFTKDGSILDLLESDHTFLNGELARHYGIAGVEGDHWRRVNGMRAQGRGGILGMAAILASQSGASRTSPILRGNWVYETLLGEKLPRPPAGVPQLPEAPPDGLTARELIEAHSSDPACARCHSRIDPYGFSLEAFDTIGRTRTNPVNTRTVLDTGESIEGLSGLREYLGGSRRAAVVRQFCRKLLGYALGREVLLSDELLLDEMERRLADNEFRFSVAVETIITSRQFRAIRGKGKTDPH